MTKNHLTNPFITLFITWTWLVIVIVIAYSPVLWAMVPMLVIWVALAVALVIREIHNRRVRRAVLLRMFGEDVDPRTLKHWRVEL